MFLAPLELWEGDSRQLYCGGFFQLWRIVGSSLVVVGFSSPAVMSEGTPLSLRCAGGL